MISLFGTLLKVKINASLTNFVVRLIEYVSNSKRLQIS